MRKLVCALAVICFSAEAFAAAKVDLNGVWNLTAFPQPDDGAIRAVPLPAGLETKSYAATVPGCCELSLMKAGELPDPMVSTNALAWRAYEGHQWLYSRTFTCPKRVAGERVMLVFDGIDTLADVFLNGKKVGEAANMLIPHAFDVTGCVRTESENTVQVLIRPIGLAARDVLLGELGLTMGGGSDHEHFRKAPYAYGWDIMPHLPVNGLWRDVRLEILPAVRIEHPAWMVTSLNVKAKSAGVRVQYRVNAPFRHWYKARVEASLWRNGRKAAGSSCVFRGAHGTLNLHVSQAAFWWPRGAGEPALYEARLEVIAEDGSVVARDVRSVGLRTIEVEYADRKLPENPGRFLFKVNGEPIYIRGVNWIPLHPIPSEQKQYLAEVLPMMADLNANLVRVWGGGVYEPDEFYDWCDQNGVMIWHDFMNACAVPPMDDAFAASMREEVLSVVLRLRNHASIALWAGDNENDIARNWGIGRKLARDPSLNRINRKVIPDVLHEYDVTRPYLPSSPLVTSEAFKGHTEPAEDHLWNGPRAWWKTAYYTNNPCWFCSEGGAHGLPARATMERMFPAPDVTRPWSNPDEKSYNKLRWTPQWLYRATNPYLDMDSYLVHRNDYVLRQTGALFGDVPRHDLDLLIAQSQSAQAESIKFQTELFRSQKFVRKGGFVVWNLRDGWPTVSDAFTDFYGNRKKAYSALRAVYRDVLVMVTEDGRLLAINDTLKPVKGRVTVVEAKDGSVVHSGDFDMDANGLRELAKLTWKGQGLYRIAYTVDGQTFTTHYLHGEPPFSWSDYRAWTAGILN